jgi:hypothetical protein
MPYAIKKSGDDFKVVNKNTGHVFGTHPSKEKAKKQLAALYVHAPHESFKRRLTQIVESL